MSKYITAHISDVHFGAVEPKMLYKQLKRYFVKPLNRLVKLDAIFIQGDLYDKKLSYESDDVKYSLKFIKDIIKIARKHINCKIRIIQGTLSHDNTQLENLLFYEDDDVDFKIIFTAQSEKLFKDFRVNYFPEEYIKNPDEYYKDLYYTKCDLVVGHGMFEEVSFTNNNSEIQMKAAPIYNVEQFNEMCWGAIMFGHIHTRQHIRNSVFYTGSFTRWMSGEPKDKGWNIAIHDTDTKRFTVAFYRNLQATVFKDIDITKALLTDVDINDLIQSIEVYMVKHCIHKLRVFIRTVSMDNQFLINIDLLRNYFNRNKDIKIVLKTELISDNNVDEDIQNEFCYLFDRELTFEDKLSKFITEQYQYDISPDRITEIMTNRTNILEDIENLYQEK